MVVSMMKKGLGIEIPKLTENLIEDNRKID